MSRGLRGRVARLERAIPVSDGADLPPPYFWQWLGGVPVPPEAEAAVLAFWEDSSRTGTDEARERDPAVQALRENRDRLGLPPDENVYDYGLDAVEELIQSVALPAQTQPVNLASQSLSE